jgi:NAD(P)H-hydrate epimerase
MSPNSTEFIQQIVVTAPQMAAIESRLFEAGMPVAALMEKVGQRLTQRLQQLYPLTTTATIGVIAGPGHNGGDALVMARELKLSGYEVRLFRPIEKAKDLTAQHLQYAQSLGIPVSDQVETLQTCDLIVEGLFGFGQERPLEGAIADAVNQINTWSMPVFSIDIPAGLHTDTGSVLGTAIRATHTVCLGLWKLAFLQDDALNWVGDAELLDFGIPPSDVTAVLGSQPSLRRITATTAMQALPLPRPAATHKYKMGHLLLVCGSRQYLGAAVLAGLGARSSGVGMLSIAVPKSLRDNLSAQLPEALIISCSEQENGAIADFPAGVSLSKYNAIACGPGLTRDAKPIVQQLIHKDVPLVLDADGLNILSELGTEPTIAARQAPTVLTPHPGEFKRLFPNIAETVEDRIVAVQKAAQQSRAIVMLKGARIAIAHPDGSVWLNPDSTPALARGGSGDVLTGLLAGLMAQTVTADQPVDAIVQTAAWWHAQAAILAAQEQTQLGVDAVTLSQYLTPALSHLSQQQQT